MKKMSEHIRTAHGLASIDYVIKHVHGGVRPVCLECGAETRYVSLSDGFKRYCPEHARLAASEGGKKGGRLSKRGPRAVKKNAPVTDDVRAVDVLQAKEDDQMNNVTKTRVSPNLVATVLSVSAVDVAAFVSSLEGVGEVQTLVTSAFPGMSLDVWVPESKVGIEIHPISWVDGEKSDIFTKTAARKKYEACHKAEARLLQFFSDEWLEHGDVCRSMIANALNMNSVKLNARDCECKEITSKESKEFLQVNHISGATRARHHIGLFHPDHGLVSVTSIRTPIQKKWGHVAELARMASKVGITVRGGASRLLKHVIEWSKAAGYEGLLSYAELRYGDGGVYDQCGFKLVTTALNNYWYSDSVKRHNRFKYRAQPGKTEKQVTEEANVRAVWGAGNNVYLVKFDEASSVPTA